MDLKWPLQYVSGKEEIRQALLLLLMTPKGTFLNYPNVGMDYTYVKHAFNPAELRLAINNCLKEDARVQKVNQINLKYNNNKINVDVSVSTTLGNIDLDKEMSTHAT